MNEQKIRNPAQLWWKSGHMTGKSFPLSEKKNGETSTIGIRSAADRS